jgi:hypothetical protein
VFWLLGGAFLCPKTVALPLFYFHDGDIIVFPYTYVKYMKVYPGIQIFFINVHQFFPMFTPCSRVVHGVLYILLEGNEKGVVAVWKG